MVAVHDGKALLGDRRHRLAVAREMGRKTMEVIARYYGPRGGIQKVARGRIAID